MLRHILIRNIFSCSASNTLSRMSYKHLYIVVLFALLFGASTMACECEGDECEFGAEMLDDDPMSAGPVVLKELIGKERMKELGVKEW